MRAHAALLAFVCMTGCALAPSPAKEEPLLPGEVRSAKAANDALSIGKSTKAQVRAALGEAVVIDFDSGYEVWAYDWAGSDFTVLFAPDGRAAKSRLRL